MIPSRPLTFNLTVPTASRTSAANSDLDLQWLPRSTWLTPDSRCALTWPSSTFLASVPLIPRQMNILSPQCSTTSVFLPTVLSGTILQPHTHPWDSHFFLPFFLWQSKESNIWKPSLPFKTKLRCYLLHEAFLDFPSWKWSFLPIFIYIYYIYIYNTYVS